jgi:hypothetical protein
MEQRHQPTQREQLSQLQRDILALRNKLADLLESAISSAASRKQSPDSFWPIGNKLLLARRPRHEYNSGMDENAINAEPHEPHIRVFVTDKRLILLTARLIGKQADLLLECQGQPNEEQQHRLDDIRRELDVIAATKAALYRAATRP